MITVIVEPSVQTILSQFTDKTELRDAAGKVIGYFTPRQVAEDEMYAEAIRSFDLEKEHQEFEKFRASGEKGYPAEEVLKELEAMEKSRCPSR